MVDAGVLLPAPDDGEEPQPSEAPFLGSVASLLAPPSEDVAAVAVPPLVAWRDSARFSCGVAPFIRARPVVGSGLRSGLASWESSQSAGMGLNAGMILMLLSRFCGETCVIGSLLRA